MDSSGTGISDQAKRCDDGLQQGFGTIRIGGMWRLQPLRRQCCRAVGWAVIRCRLDKAKPDDGAETITNLPFATDDMIVGW